MYDKITSRVEHQAFGLSPMVDPVEITKRVVVGMYPGITTVELDTLAAETAASLSVQHPDYGILASRIEVSNLHKQTPKSFYKAMDLLRNYIEPKTGKPAPMIGDETWAVIEKHNDELEGELIHKRDSMFSFFGFRTLKRSYLLKRNGKITERPQHMYMRVAIGIHGDDIPAVIETYHLLSKGFFSHASPTMFNAGTPRDQLSSCFLLQMKDDSIEGIYETLKRCAIISKSAGGIGLSVHNIRASGSYIAGTNGTSNGLVPMLRVFNNTARYVDQGGNKRPGAFACYLEPWHADVRTFLDLRKNTGMEELRARDLFYALWIPDLFMERVKANGKWTFMCPKECPGLSDVWGDEFVELYERYEAEGKGRETIDAQKLWFAIVESQTETGTPYMLYKDACNRKSNQQNLGTIKCSNLCTEIVEYTSPDEIAVCNLASLVLNKHVKVPELPERTASRASVEVFSPSPASASPGPGSPSFDTPTISEETVEFPTFDFKLLHENAKVLTRNLNRVIDRSYNPLPECKASNMRNRPIGIGVQGLADTFALMGFPFDSKEAKELNLHIFETIYHGALEASIELAEKDGRYETYEGSPFSRGLLQQDLWALEKEAHPERSGAPEPSGMWDWDALRAKMKIHGTRNSLLLAPMPTASTAQILGNNEAIEAFTNNVYNRRVLAGEFQVINKYMLADLEKLGLWCTDLRQEIIANNGSIQTTPENVDRFPRIARIPSHIKQVYKTVWELSQKTLIDMAADRGAYIDQSQSFNVHISDPDTQKLSSMHFYGWSKGLKTGMYYLRTRAAASAIQFTVDQSKFRRGEGCGDACSA